MNVGTKSLLFGVHQFAWHPWTVIRAYRAVHGVWPMFDECLCILVHDWGYWGCPNMDGEQGKLHPERGAKIAKRLVQCWYYCFKKCPYYVALQYAEEAHDRTLYHSSHYARLNGAKPSALYLPDKASILFEPRWWYLLRARLSGEVREYISNSPFGKLPPELRTAGGWYNDYVQKVKNKLAAHGNSK